MLITIACPLDMEHPEVNPATAPIWTDGVNSYRVASGIVNAEPTEWTQAQPDRITVVGGMDGLAALAAMGLTLPEASNA